MESLLIAKLCCWFFLDISRTDKRLQLLLQLLMVLQGWTVLILRLQTLKRPGERLELIKQGV